MIVVADINTIWRKKPFEALAEITPAMGLAPRDILSAWRKRLGCNAVVQSVNSLQEYPVLMLPGWASCFSNWSAKRLWSFAAKKVGGLGGGISALVVTSPHYLPLIQLAKQSVPTFYYCSDDYGQYDGWGGDAMLRLEADVVREVGHSFFVSSTLAERAVKEYNVSSTKVSVSPNATDDNFVKMAAEQDLNALMARHPQLRRPLVGVVGGINGRLDFELLLRCASVKELGSLVMVGPVAADLNNPAFKRLFKHPRCFFVGPQPHADLRLWMQSLDVALIPYRENLFNRSCSPMRLFDHLAAGRPIVATSACAQIREFANIVRIGNSPEELLVHLVEACQRKLEAKDIERSRALAMQNTWASRADNLKQVIQKASVGNF